MPRIARPGRPRRRDRGDRRRPVRPRRSRGRTGRQVSFARHHSAAAGRRRGEDRVKPAPFPSIAAQSKGTNDDRRPAVADRRQSHPPVPRRIRAMKDDETLLDTTRALYVWEWPHYPQYYVPRADVGWTRCRGRDRHDAARRGARARTHVRRGRTPSGRSRDHGVADHRCRRYRAFGMEGARPLVRRGRRGLRPPAAAPTSGSTRFVPIAPCASSWKGTVLATRAAA